LQDKHNSQKKNNKQYNNQNIKNKPLIIKQR